MLKVLDSFKLTFHRFTDDAFDPEQAATIGVDFKVKTVSLNNGDKVRIHMTLTRGIISHAIRSTLHHCFSGETGHLGHSWAGAVQNPDAVLLQGRTGSHPGEIMTLNFV